MDLFIIHKLILTCLDSNSIVEYFSYIDGLFIHEEYFKYYWLTGFVGCSDICFSFIILYLEGTVGAIQDRGGLASAAGISVGDTVRYVVEIDTDRTGFYTGWNGQDQEVRGSHYAHCFRVI